MAGSGRVTRYSYEAWIGPRVPLWLARSAPLSMEFKSVGHLLVSYVEQSWRYFNAYEGPGMPGQPQIRRKIFLRYIHHSASQ